jgi:hypothetical protein
MPLSQLLKNVRKRETILANLDEVYQAVFGEIGEEPDVYADYDRCVELKTKMRNAINALRVS